MAACEPGHRIAGWRHSRSHPQFDLVLDISPAALQGSIAVPGRPAFCHSVQLRQRFVAPLEKRPADVLSVAHGHQPVRRVRITGIVTRDLFFNRAILLKQLALQHPELFEVSDVGFWRNFLAEEQFQ